MSLLLSLALAGMSYIPSSPSLGVAEGRCRPNEPGPAILVRVEGLRDRVGRLRLELYPSNDQDFLADDNVLVMAGKIFRRVLAAIPPQGPVVLCIRVPRAGPYSLSLLHDRDGNGRFSIWQDGIGFAGNPSLGMSRPHAADARIVAGTGLIVTRIVMNYRQGLGFGPIEH